MYLAGVYHEVPYFLNELVGGFSTSFLFFLLTFACAFGLTSLDSQGFTSPSCRSCGGVEKDLVHFPKLISGDGIEFLVAVGMFKVF